MDTAYLGKVDVTAPVLVLIKCEDIYRIGRYTERLTKMFIRSFTVSRSKAVTVMSKLTSSSSGERTSPISVN